MDDEHGESCDLREENSWTLRLHEVDTQELLEVLLINTAAPILLTARLKPLMLRSRFEDRYVINVTGLDGQFSRASKSPCHPHLNASKAALNMITCTSAQDYARDCIYMNGVDTGWITLEGGYSKRARMLARGFRPPLDEVDGAARICDPVLRGLEGYREFGLLWRNYAPAAW